MANRDCKDLQCLSREVKVVAGIISILGAAVATSNVVTLRGDLPNSVSVNGIASVARTGVGLITLTLTDRWVGLVSAMVNITPHAGAARGINLGAVDVVTAARTVVIRTLNASLVATDTPNTETDLIHFALFLKNSTVR